jgi:hypothetical protein
MTDTQQPSGNSSISTGAPPTAKKGRIDLAEVQKGRAVEFLEAIMADLVESQHNEIKGVMSSVPDPYTGSARNVIIRQDDYIFWNQLLEGLAVEDVNTPKRVAAVGTPGIGKSTTSSFAIRLLLQQGKTVVYLLRTSDGSGYYIQFSPSEDGQVDIELIPEKTSPTDIPSLYDPESYYLVDPGKTKTSCDPAPMVAARVIIVTSPDERHWGGSAFEKNDQTGLGGYFLYFPSWNLPQLEAGSDELSGVQFRNGEVAALYAIFGGVPRHIFFPMLKDRKEAELKRKVDAMSDNNLRDLVTGQLNRHSGFGADQPGGGVVEFVPCDNFKDVELKLASASILRWVRMRFMNSIWIPMATYPSPISWQLLEDYMLYALQNVNQYATRTCVSKTDASYNNLANHGLGQCTGKSLAADCTSSVLVGSDLTVFYSSDRMHPLYDMIYKVGNIYYAFQITLGNSHDAKQRQIDSLVQRLQIGIGGRELRLYYAVHEGAFDNFVTKPVTPNAARGVSIFHLKLEKGLLA